MEVIPNIKINNITIIIPAMITGIKNRRIARATIAISTIISKVIIDPLYDIMPANPFTKCKIEKIVNDIMAIRDSFSES